MYIFFCDFEIETDYLISDRRPDLVIAKKIVDFTVPVDHRVELKEDEKKDKYLDLASEWKNLWNMKVIVMRILTLSVDPPKV